MIPVRPATPEDATACAAILNDWIDATPWMPRIHDVAAVHRHFREDVLPRRRVWVAGAPVAGFLALDTKTQTITALYCAQTGRGLGPALLARAKAQGSHLALWTFEANTGARRFYAREGFREAGRSAGENAESLPDILMRWESAA